MRHIGLALLASICLTPSVLSQSIIIGNLPQTNDTTQTADVDDLRQKGMRFTMPISASAVAGDLIVRLRNYDSAGDGPILELRDFTGSTTTPGTNVLLTFTAPVPGVAGVFNYTFTPDASFSLLANTTYWIVLRGNSGSSFDWTASSPSITPTGSATWGSTSFTSNGGTTWANSAIITSFQFNEFVAVPEPATVGMLGIAAGLAGFYTVRRLRKGKRRMVKARVQRFA